LLHEIRGNTGLETLFYTYKIDLIPIANILYVKRNGVKNDKFERHVKTNESA
jgi:hypothetical protein